MATGLTEFLDNFVKNHDNRQLLAFPLAILAVSPVSYTHLDVYKRQVYREELPSKEKWNINL